MKTFNKIFLTLAATLFLLPACEDSIEDRVPSPVMPGNNQGVFFPTTNKSEVELDPTDPTEVIYTISRTDTVNAVEVPITVEINGGGVFVVPAKVAFAALQKTTTFKVTFPTAEEGITYNLKLAVVGDDYANPYQSTVSYVATAVTRIKWVLIDPVVYVDACFTAFYSIPNLLPMYVETEKATLGTATRYRFKNAYQVATDVDADGIHNGYPYNDPGDFDESQDYYTIIEVKNGKVSMFPNEIGVDWGTGMFSIGTILGNVSTSPSYVLGTIEGDVITFPANSLYMSRPGATRVVSTPTIIYLTKAAYLATE